jgi:hypothetical protein
MAESSPVLPKKALRCTVFNSAGMGRKRREQRPRWDAFRGRRSLGAALAMAGSGESSPELAKLALEATIGEDKGMGRKRG